MSAKFSRRLSAALAVGLVLSLSLAGVAEARRGGSFGSRGARTYAAPATTATAPQSVGPVQRSMTAPYAQPGYAQPGYGYPGYRRPGLFGGWGGPILGGLFAAGLFGMLGGHGFGGGGGFLALLVQIGLIVLVASLAMRLFRRGLAPAGPSFLQPSPYAGGLGPQPLGPQPMGYAPSGPWGGRDGVGLVPADFSAFEQLLTEIQAAYSREDYEALRARTTPEVMSYLAEELAQSAAAGRRNEVRDVRLLSGDLSEAWSEGAHDYATVALRYASVDVMRDRADGHVIQGGDAATETTEVWTFLRDRASPWGPAWKLSAIQS